MAECETGFPDRSKPVILIVDDDAQSLQILNMLLDCCKGDYSIVCAKNGKEGLEAVYRHMPDVILLDIMMPELNGLEVCQRLKADPKTAHIPIIFLTGKGDTEDIVEGFEAGAVDYVVKPFQAPELLARLNTQLDLKLSKDKLRKNNSQLAESQARMEKMNQELETMNQELKSAYHTLEKDLTEAAEYVKSMLPAPGKYAHKLPYTDWIFEPSQKLGGDILGYHWLDDDHFAFYLLDVSGHGVGAALLSVSVMSLLSFEILNNTDFKDPACVLGKLNENFLQQHTQGMFYTIWYGVYVRSQHKLIYSNAGHPPGILLTGETAETAETVRLTAPGVLVGAIPGFEYKNHEVRLKKFNRLFLYSDGTYEVIRNDTRRMMRLSEWITLLEDINRRHPEDQFIDLKELADHIHALKKDEKLEDDFTILKLKF